MSVTRANEKAAAGTEDVSVSNNSARKKASGEAEGLPANDSSPQRSSILE